MLANERFFCYRGHAPLEKLLNEHECINSLCELPAAPEGVASCTQHIKNVTNMCDSGNGAWTWTCGSRWIHLCCFVFREKRGLHSAKAVHRSWSKTGTTTKKQHKNAATIRTNKRGFWHLWPVASILKMTSRAKPVGGGRADKAFADIKYNNTCTVPAVLVVLLCINGPLLCAQGACSKVLLPLTAPRAPRGEQRARYSFSRSHPDSPYTLSGAERPVR